MSESLRTTDAARIPAAGPLGSLLAVVPGVLAAAAVAAIAFALLRLPGAPTLSPLIVAVVGGMLARAVLGVPGFVTPGLAFSVRRLLRLAIVLLGLQVTAAQLAELGLANIAAIVAALVACFGLTVVLGRLLGIEPGLSRLIAAGTAICGASAVVAMGSATRARDEEIAYATTCVTLFGTLAMFAVPAMAGYLALDAHAAGNWIGASVHEVAQVVAAGDLFGSGATEQATLAKLFRVLMLGPIVLVVGYLAGRRRSSSTPAARAPFPWFAVGFLAMAALNSVASVPVEVKGGVALVTTFLLAMALAAVGMTTDLRKVVGTGWRPLLLSLASFLVIATLSLALMDWNVPD